MVRLRIDGTVFAMGHSLPTTAMSKILTSSRLSLRRPLKSPSPMVLSNSLVEDG
jgi:hypothetical protein